MRYLNFFPPIEESAPIPYQSPQEQGLEGGLLLDKAVPGHPRRGLSPDDDFSRDTARWGRDL